MSNTQKKFTVGKQAYTIFGGTGEVVKVGKKKVHMKDMFGNTVKFKHEHVFHSKAVAWGSKRSV